MINKIKQCKNCKEKNIFEFVELLNIDNKLNSTLFIMDYNIARGMGKLSHKLKEIDNLNKLQQENYVNKYFPKERSGLN